MRIVAMVIAVSATALAVTSVHRDHVAPGDAPVPVHKVTGVSRELPPSVGKITGVSRR